MSSGSAKVASTVDPLDDPMVPPAYRIQAMVDGLDQVALAMERKWGVDRLRLLVPDLLRAKFDEQKDRLDQALATNNEIFVCAQVEGMRRAWDALDRAAREAGQAPLSPEIWECVLADTGEIVSLVRTEVEAQHVARAGRVFTLAEIATLIAALGDGELKGERRVSEAKTTAVRCKPPVDWLSGDEIPF